MSIDLGLPGHEGFIAGRFTDGELRMVEDGEEPAGLAGYRATCSCGWSGRQDHAGDQFGRMEAVSELVDRHLKPFISATPPAWLVGSSRELRTSVDELSMNWPLQSLSLLADIERWHRPLLEEVVVRSRAAGKSWADIGAALGITKQSAHERFRGVVGERAANINGEEL